MLVTGQLEAWQIGPDMWALVEWMHTRYGRTVKIWTIYGPDQELERGAAFLEQIARANGAKLIFSHGRPGWRKIAKALDCEVLESIVIIKEL